MVDVVNINGSNNSTGPFNVSPYNVGDGNGFYPGSPFNAGVACGNLIGSPNTVNGAAVAALCTNGSGGNHTFVVIAGTRAQSFFTTMSFTATGVSDAGNFLSFSTASAAYYDTTTFPGYTLWGWNSSVGNAYPFSGATAVTFTTTAPPPSGGYGDFPDPMTWQDASGNIPPQQFNKVPANLQFPHNSDGRYWWTGNALTAPLGAITFIGDQRYISGTMQLQWSLVQVATDGSIPNIAYSLNGGSTYTSAPLGPFAQNKGLISGSIQIPLTVTETVLVKVTSSGGTPSATAALWEVAVAITRNEASLPVWNVNGGPGSADQSALNPFNYNTQIPFQPPYDTLSTLQARLMIRLGFSNQLAVFPPGMAAMTHEFLQSAQNFLYRRFTALHTRRWFRWKLIPLERFYSLLDNDENQILGYGLDTDKTIEQVMVQDTRNVWYPLIEGIPGQLYTMLAKPWRPARYDIRDVIEIYPAPDQTYFLWVKGHFGLLSFQQPSDQTTIDSELVFLQALANAKAHYGHPDADKVMAEANAMRANLVGATHKTAKYVPGTIPVPPAVRPTLIQFSDSGNG